MNLTPSDTEKQRTEGNTIASVRSRNWIFTLNNYIHSDILTLITIFNNDKCLYIFQEETGDNGTPHLQGCVRYPNAIRFSSLKDINSKIHWEKCIDWKCSVSYCSKLDTRTGNVFHNLNIDITADPLNGIPLREWQQYIINIIKQKPDDRKIYWFWDKYGNTGKTTFSKHLAIKYKASYVSGSSKDIKYAIINSKPKPKIIIWDIPRTQENYISYEGIESVKNGIFFSGKYESGTCIFDIPHIIIFANFAPNTSTLSEDRWEIHNLNNSFTSTKKSKFIVNLD